ncbi:MAG: shikimate kinase [Firmicutes bacterium]|nr:shikimate kinase [Bacillota bacterium]
MQSVKQNLVLIGMPGAGKSTVGVLAAKALGMAFIDTDLLLQQREKRLLQEILVQEGMQNFLSLEEKTVLSVHTQNCVIATGGSVIYSERSMQHLKQHGLIVYLALPYDALVQRIHNMAARGIVMGKNQTLAELYAERKSKYEKYAEVTVNCTQLTIEESVQQVCTVWQNYQKNYCPLELKDD